MVSLVCNWLLSDLAPGPASPFPSPSSYLGLLVSFRGLTTYSAQDRSHLRQSRFKPYYLWFSIISLPAALFLRLAPCLTNQVELLVTQAVTFLLFVPSVWKSGSMITSGALVIINLGIKRRKKANNKKVDPKRCQFF